MPLGSQGRRQRIVTGRGGDGGLGGIAKVGGVGGPGGSGGLGSGMAKPGCAGFNGGQGGAGGYGGGGLGGPSIGVAYVVGQQPAFERNTLDIGQPGHGAPAVNPVITWGAGADGFAEEMTGFPLGDGEE